MHTTIVPARTPARVQRTRIPGRPGMPPGARYVGRGSKWGNPARVVRSDHGLCIQWGATGGLVGTWPASGVEARRYAVELYRQHLINDPGLVEAAERELAGRDLACWCPLPEPGLPDHCHATVLLRVAAGGEL